MPMRDAIESLDYDGVLEALQRNEDPNQIFEAHFNIYHMKGTLKGYRKSQMTPLLFAINRDRADMAALLIEHGGQSDVAGCDEPALNQACKKGMFPIAKQLLEKNAQTDRADAFYETLLISVINGSHLERTNNFQELTKVSLDAIKDMLQALQQHGVSLDPINNVYDGNCPLYVAACQLKDKGLVGVLLELGASIHLVNYRGNTLLERLYEAEHWGNDDNPNLEWRSLPLIRETAISSDDLKDWWPNDTPGSPVGFKMLSHILNTLSDLGRDDQIEQAKNNLKIPLQSDLDATERRARIAKTLEGYLGCQKRVQAQIQAVGRGVAKDAALSHVHILDFLTRQEQHFFSAASKTKKTKMKRPREEMNTEVMPLGKKAKVVRDIPDYEFEIPVSPKGPKV